MQLTGSNRPSISHHHHQQPELQLLFQQVMLHFQLWLLQGLMQHATPATITRQLTNTIMAALQRVVQAAAVLAVDYGQDMQMVEDICTAMKQKLVDAVAAQQLQETDGWSLWGSNTTSDRLLEGWAGNWVLPTGVVPGQPPVSNDQEDLQAVLRRAEKNLGSLPYMTYSETNSLKSALQDLKRLLEYYSSSSDGALPTTSQDTARQHGLRSVEALFFGRIAPSLPQAAKV